MPEIQLANYYSKLRDDTEIDNVRRYISFIHEYLIAEKLKTTMIGYGSVVTGIRSGDDEKESDIDTRVMANFSWGVDKLTPLLDQMRECPAGFSLERKGPNLMFRPDKGRPIELVYQSVEEFEGIGHLALVAGTHLSTERKRDTSFVILYQDKQ